MSDRDEDAFGGNLFEDWLDNLDAAGRVASAVGQLRYRAGGNSRDWSAPGSSKYLPGDWHMQAGCFRKMFTARKSGGFEISFPTPFAEPPLVIANIGGTLPQFEEARFQSTIQSSSVVEIYWWSTNNLTRIWINWLALGPIGI